MGGKKPAAGGGEGSKKAQGQARKADAAASKAAAGDAKREAAEAAEWNKGAKSNAKQSVLSFVSCSSMYSRHFPKGRLSTQCLGPGPRSAGLPPPRFISHTLLSMPHVGMRNPFPAFPKTQIRPPVLRCIFGYTVPADRAEPQGLTPC